MDILYQCKEVLKIQKFRRMVSYAGFYCFTALITYAYTSNTYVATEPELSLLLQVHNFITCSVVHVLTCQYSSIGIFAGQGLGSQGLTSIMLPTLLVLSY